MVSLTSTDLPSLKQISLREIVLSIVQSNVRWRRLDDVSFDFRRMLKIWQIPAVVKSVILDELDGCIREIRRWSN